MSRNLLVALALAVLSLAVAAPAHAVLITINFTVTGAAADPANAVVTTTGSFSFDSSIAPTGGGPVSLPATSGFNLVWDGTTWNDGNTGAFELVFDTDGNLTEANMFGNPSTFFMVISPDPVDDFKLVLLGDGSFFSYTREGVEQQYQGAATWSVSSGAAPEPGTLALFAPGLLALGLVRRRKS
jgi:hypothetical protein